MLTREEAGTRLKTRAATFGRNKNSEIYVEILEELVSTYRASGCNMSLRLHFLQSRLDFFPGNMGAVSDEHVEKFHQDISRTNIYIYIHIYIYRAANVTQICWLITAECLHGRYQQKNARDKRRQNEFLLHLFICK